jgi:hypothetical protein
VAGWVFFFVGGGGGGSLTTTTNKKKKKNRYEKMALRYEAAGVFFVGVVAVFSALLGGCLRGAARMLQFAAVGLVFYSVLQAARFRLPYVNGLRVTREANVAAFPAADANYLGGALLAYLGFLLQAAAAPGVGVVAELCAVKTVLFFLVTVVAAAAIFVTGSARAAAYVPGPPGPATVYYEASMYVIAVTFLAWLYAALGLLAGSRALAGAGGVVFGCYSFYILMRLLQINDGLVDATTLPEAKQTRAGMVLGWVSAFLSFWVAGVTHATSPPREAKEPITTARIKFDDTPLEPLPLAGPPAAAAPQQP